MGEIRTSVRLENTGDREYVHRGDRAEADVRRTTVEGIVDTGAVNLVIPEEIARGSGCGTTEREPSSTRTSAGKSGR
jgi:predicted aspartyl protease